VPDLDAAAGRGGVEAAPMAMVDPVDNVALATPEGDVLDLGLVDVDAVDELTLDDDVDTLDALDL
jgi:hypothetical protein